MELYDITTSWLFLVLSIIPFKDFVIISKQNGKLII